MKFIGSKLCVSVAAAFLLALSTCSYAQDAPVQKETKITPEQKKELFRSLNQILSFASDDSQLQIKHEVKKRLITREEVEKYILDKFHEARTPSACSGKRLCSRSLAFLTAISSCSPLPREPFEGADRSATTTTRPRQ